LAARRRICVAVAAGRGKVGGDVDPTDRPDDLDDPFAVAEAAQVAARETVPVDRPTEAVAVDRPTEAVDRPTGAVDRPTEAVDRPTEAVGQKTEAVGHRTVLVDDKVLGDRPTVKVPGQRRPSGQPARRAPLPVAVAFATLWAAVLCYLPSPPSSAWPAPWRGRAARRRRARRAGRLAARPRRADRHLDRPARLPPLLLTLLIVWRLNRAGLHVTRAIGARRSGGSATRCWSRLRIALCIRCSARWPRSRRRQGHRGPRPAPRSTSSSSACSARWPGRCAAPTR
jgi:hypothetical protein